MPCPNGNTVSEIGAIVSPDGSAVSKTGWNFFLAEAPYARQEGLSTTNGAAVSETGGIVCPDGSAVSETGGTIEHLSNVRVDLSNL